MKSSELLGRLHLRKRALAIDRLVRAEANCERIKGCTLRVLNRAMAGEELLLTEEVLSCSGAARGFGFLEGLPQVPGGFGHFLTAGAGEGFPVGERIKCSAALAEQMIENQPTGVMEGYTALRVGPLGDAAPPELVALDANADQLSALAHLFYYRKASYDEVIMPMSAGCASMFRIPFGEIQSGRRRAVIGNIDIFSRPHFDRDRLFFMVDGQSWREMCEDADESFLNAPIWSGVKKRLTPV